MILSTTSDSGPKPITFPVIMQNRFNTTIAMFLDKTTYVVIGGNANNIGNLFDKGYMPDWDKYDKAITLQNT